jgi:hypothetical protein
MCISSVYNVQLCYGAITKDIKRAIYGRQLNCHKAKPLMFDTNVSLKSSQFT